MKNKILCISPLYNKIRFLPYTIGSILNQEDVEVQLVIVDDHSTDGSWEWCQENLSEFPNVHLLRNEENKGCYVSRNRGLNYAIENNIEFDYYTVTDPDDQQFPNRFKMVLASFNQHPYTCFKQSYIRVNIDTNESVEKSDAGEGAAVYKREVFDKIGYFDNTMKFSGDTEYVIRLANYYHKNGEDHNKKVGKINTPLLYALTDNTGQNLTRLYPTEHPLRQATFDYINTFTDVAKLEDCYYEFTNEGNPYTSLGAMAKRD